MTGDYIIFGAPQVGEDEIGEVVDSLRSGWWGTGPKVQRFEEAFARYKDVPASRAAAVNSCTAALHVSMIAAGVGPGDEVITTPLTFCATINAIIHAGATPVLADIDPRTLNIDPIAVAAKLGPRTRAVVPVHFAGRAADMDALIELTGSRDLILIEDCAHAVETEYRGVKAGRLGNFGCFSFYVTKNVATGEGGMVLARSESELARVKMLSLHGMSTDAWHRYSDEGFRHYQVVEVGFKYNMMDLQAAIGLHQLERVEANWQRRREIWRYYQESFAKLPITLPADAPADERHAHHLYCIQVQGAADGMRRDRLMQSLHERGIGTGVHYRAIPEHPVYRERFGWRPQDCPAAWEVGRKILSIPLSAALSDGDVERVAAAVAECACP